MSFGHESGAAPAPTDSGSCIELRLPAEATYAELAQQVVAFAALRLGFSEPDVGRWRLAVAEAVANALLYGPDDAATLTVICDEPEPGTLRVQVIDAGEPFELERVPPPRLDAPPEKRRIGGLGLHLMRQLVDTVTVQPLPTGQSGKAVVLSKRRSRDETVNNG